MFEDPIWQQPGYERVLGVSITPEPNWGEGHQADGRLLQFSSTEVILQLRRVHWPL
jgi:hypothetical protein